MKKMGCPLLPCSSRETDPILILDKIDENMDSLRVKMLATRYQMSEAILSKDRHQFKQKEGLFNRYLSMYRNLERISDEIQSVLDSADIAAGMGLAERLLSNKLSDFAHLDQLMDNLEDQMVQSAEISESLTAKEIIDDELILPSVPIKREQTRVALYEL